MDTVLSTLLLELEAFAKQNDEQAESRGQKMLNITRDTGEFLSLLIKTKNVKSVLEIGTSNGYSTLWLASAVVANQGLLKTIELSATKAALATINFEKANLSHSITQYQLDAGQVFPIFADGEFDFIFLDSDRKEYLGWLPQIKRLLGRRGLLVVDNACSHAHELVDFCDAIISDNEFDTGLVPVGKGEFLAVKV